MSSFEPVVSRSEQPFDSWVNHTSKKNLVDMDGDFQAGKDGLLILGL